MKKLKKDLEKKEKRANHKSIYMSNCLEFDFPYSMEEESLLFEASCCWTKSEYGKDKEKGDRFVCL